MAYHFSANQFEDQYNPRKLGNWEYPKWYPERPRQRTKPTKIIADENGRLLEGIKKGNPWGTYVGTWDLPKRITREFAEKLAAPPERVLARWQKKKESHQTEVKEETTESAKPAESTEQEHLPALQVQGKGTSLDSFQKRNRSSSALDLRPKLEHSAPSKAPAVEDESRSEEYDRTKRVNAIIESIQEKKTPQLKLGEICQEIKALPATCKEKSQCYDDSHFTPVPKYEEGSREYTKYLDNHLNKFDIDKSEVEEEEKDVILPAPPEALETMEKSPEKPKPSYQIAKRYQEENLKHQPLPDVIEDPVFKALGSRRHPNPGCDLKLEPNAAAIGWRGYGAPGPTQCSKMRIYRPKTSVADQVKSQTSQRPKTSDSKLNKTEKHFSQMELAICWDLIPEDPHDEPKPSPHIDGTNGSVAPAVFSIVKSESKCDDKQNIIGSPQAVAERILPDIQPDNAANLPSKNDRLIPITTNKEAIMAHIKQSPILKQGSPDSLNSISSSAAEIARKNPKTAWTGTDTSKTLSRKLLELQKENNPNAMNGSDKSRRSTIESDISHLSRKKQYQSSPNLVHAGCQTNRRCSGSNCGTEKSSSKSSEVKDHKMDRRKIRSCDCCDRTDSNPEKVQEKSEFKCAFKAGVPNNSSSSSSTPPSAKPLKIPKMRLPYAKRSYSISTLIPPFSLWSDNRGQGYPDHWRLSSVYQHSYKPIDYRKRSLLAGVYQ